MPGLNFSQACIDNEIGAGAAARLVGRDEKRNAGNVTLAEAKLERLQVEELLVRLG